ncbi:MAG: hypothetical protein RR214_01820 [Synergistaceae bacterium]
MAMARSSSFKFGIIFLCLIMGTWLGIFLQRFAPTAAIFTNVVDFTFNLKELDLVMLKFSFLFALKLNLGTLLGGVAGLWISR